MTVETAQTWKIGDCMELLPEIETGSIDMILCDLPYGTSGNKWDFIIPIKPLFDQYRRIIKDNGVIVLTSAQPFTSMLIMENLDIFKYCWVWNKNSSGGFLNAKNRPLSTYEDIVIFSKGGCTTGSKIRMNYNPQVKTKLKPIKRKCNINMKNVREPKLQHLNNKEIIIKMSKYDYPKSIINITNTIQKDRSHPTQKPVELFEYLIKTYTNEGDTVHDSCLGSGTTLEACRLTNRNCIGFEISDEWEKHYSIRTLEYNKRLSEWI